MPTRSETTNCRRGPHHRFPVLVFLCGLLGVLAFGCSTTMSPADPAGAAPGAIGPANQTDQNDDEPQLTERQQRQIDLIAPILLDATNGPDDGRRLAAAQELLALQLDNADQILKQALTSNHPNQMNAVLRALITGERVPDSLVTTALEILPMAPKPAQDTLRRFLAQHEADVLEAVSATALDPSVAAEHRLNAIGALGAFRTRDAADRLITLLKTDRQEPEAIVSAACDALTRLTRLPYGNQPDTWRTWWVQAKNQTREQWLVDQVQRLATERSELERELTLQRQRVTRIEQRVVDVLRDLFRALPSDVDQQLAPLPTLLDDELVVVREFAIERIRFISRDHEIPASLQDALSARLDDSDAGIRARASRLLQELNYPGLNESLATRLADETSFDVIETYITLLADRPTRSALPALIRRIGDPNLCDPACRATWRVLQLKSDEPIEPEQLEAIRTAVTSAIALRETAPLVRLAAYLADDDQVAQYETHLDSEDNAVRTAVAEGLASRMRLDPLLSRADDAVIYPITVRALVARQPNVDALQALIQFSPPDESTAGAWSDALGQMLARIAPPQLIAADDLLVQAGTAPELRIGLLSRAAGMTAEQLPVEQRTEVAIRLAQIHVSRAQYLKAHQELETIAATNGSAELKALRFKAALLSGHYNRAAELQPQAEPWIEQLALVVGNDDALAGRIQAEIEQRFGESLNDDMKTRLEALRNKINGQAPTAPSAASANDSAMNASPN